MASMRAGGVITVDPVADPELTLRQVRAQAAGVLPGVRVRRLLFLALPPRVAQVGAALIGTPVLRGRAGNQTAGMPSGTKW